MEHVDNYMTCGSCGGCGVVPNDPGAETAGRPCRDCMGEGWVPISGRTKRTPTDHADFSANCVGIIGDSADKRFTFVRTDGRIGDPCRLEFFYIIDWEQARKDILNNEVGGAADRAAVEWKKQGPSPGLGYIGERG